MQAGLLARFFDGVMRRAFGDLGMDDPAAGRYLTDLLTRFARQEALAPLSVSTRRRLETVADSLLEIQRVWEWQSPGFDPWRERALRRHVGDYALFMTGIFRDHVERLSATDYFQREGQRAYRFVAETSRTASAPEEAELFVRLAQRFERYAGTLTYIRKVYFHEAAVRGGLPLARLFPHGRLAD